MAAGGSGTGSQALKILCPMGYRRTGATAGLILVHVADVLLISAGTATDVDAGGPAESVL
jgi:hypothetical protein